MSDRCEGTRIGFKLLCNGSQYKCLHCGAIGCKQNKPEICSQQLFTALETCTQCGTAGQLALVAPASVGFRRTLMHDGTSA